MDFLANQNIFKSDRRSNDIYKIFRDKYAIKYQDLFVTVAAIGFISNRKCNLEDRANGIELRSNYLVNNQKSTIYTIILNDPEYGKEIEKFQEKDNVTKYLRLVEEYAEGGMTILIENVFKSKWNGVSLDKNYQDYDLDIISYYLSFMDQVPF